MKDNNTTPAMKEVETVEQAAIRHCELEHAKNSDDNFHTHIETYYRVHAPHFIAGANWREENPVKPVAKEGVSARDIAKEILYMPVTNNQGEASIQKGTALIEAYHAQFATDAGEKSEVIAKAKREYETGKIGFVQALEQVYQANAPSTHSSSEMVFKEKVLAIIDNAGYIDVEFRINLTSQINRL